MNDSFDFECLNFCVSALFLPSACDVAFPSFSHLSLSNWSFEIDAGFGCCCVKQSYGTM